MRIYIVSVPRVLRENKQTSPLKQNTCMGYDFFSFLCVSVYVCVLVCSLATSSAKDIIYRCLSEMHQVCH